jgi:hypothetical protein
MGPNCDLAEISTFYYDIPIGPHFSDKLKVWNLDLKLCAHEGLHQTSLPTKFQNFWINYLRDTTVVCWQKDAFLWILCYAWIFWKIHISEIISPKVLKFCRQASLMEAFVQSKFQV